MAKRTHCVIYKGSANLITDTLDPLVPGGISGWTIVFNFKRTKDDAAAIVGLSDLAATIIDPLACSFGCPLTYAQSKLFTDFGTYVGDARRIDSGQETLLSDITITVREGVRPLS